MNAIDEFKKSQDQFKAVSVSNHHIRESDSHRLSELAECREENQVLGFEYGWRIKLLADIPGEPRKDPREYLPELSEECYQLFDIALAAGFLLVELDADATVYDTLPVFDW